MRVPLDHSRPNGAKINLSLARIPAADPAAKIGSLFLNPGGPGGSGVDFALFFGCSARSTIADGDKVEPSVDTTRTHLFDPTTGLAIT